MNVIGFCGQSDACAVPKNASVDAAMNNAARREILMVFPLDLYLLNSFFFKHLLMSDDFCGANDNP